MDNIAIKVTNLSYKYSATDNLVLDDISLSVPERSFFTLVGPSGSGKSTLISLIRGFYQEIGGVFQGEIIVDGKNVNTTSISELGKDIGIVFQNPALQLHQLRVIDEVMSAPMYQGLPFEVCRGKALSSLEHILEKEFYQCSPSELSAGQQQRVAVAASLSLDANILLLDEPFSFLDENADKRLVDVLVDLQRKGVTIILATHNITRVLEHTTHMGVMNEGKLVLSGDPKDIVYSDDFSKIMPAPLFVNLARNCGVSNKPLSWEELLPNLGALNVQNKDIENEKTEEKLVLDNVSFNYPGTKKGVDTVSISMNKGEILGIVGANGSGKTTLAKAILGLVTPSSGKVVLNRVDITKLSLDERARKIGYATQDPLDMFFENTLVDEVAAGPKFLNIDEPKFLAEKALEQFDLLKYKEKHPDSISGGEKSKLGIADILVNNTEILLLDEPEFGLDPRSWKDITKILKDLSSAGKTIIVIIQDLQEAFFLCDRIALMSKGKLIKVGTPIEIFSDEKLLSDAGLSSLPFSPLLENLSGVEKISEDDFIKGVRRLNG